MRRILSLGVEVYLQKGLNQNTLNEYRCKVQDLPIPSTVEMDFTSEKEPSTEIISRPSMELDWEVLVLYRIANKQIIEMAKFVKAHV